MENNDEGNVIDQEQIMNIINMMVGNPNQRRENMANAIDNLLMNVLGSRVTRPIISEEEQRRIPEYQGIFDGLLEKEQQEYPIEIVMPEGTLQQEKPMEGVSSRMSEFLKENDHPPVSLREFADYYRNWKRTKNSCPCMNFGGFNESERQQTERIDIEIAATVFWFRVMKGYPSCPDLRDLYHYFLLHKEFPQDINKLHAYIVAQQQMERDP